MIAIRYKNAMDVAGHDKDLIKAISLEYIDSILDAKLIGMINIIVFKDSSIILISGDTYDSIILGSETGDAQISEYATSQKIDGRLLIQEKNVFLIHVLDSLNKASDKIHNKPKGMGHEVAKKIKDIGDSIEGGTEFDVFTGYMEREVESNPDIIKFKIRNDETVFFFKDGSKLKTKLVGEIMHVMTTPPD